MATGSIEELFADFFYVKKEKLNDGRYKVEQYIYENICEKKGC